MEQLDMQQGVGTSADKHKKNTRTIIILLAIIILLLIAAMTLFFMRGNAADDRYQRDKNAAEGLIAGRTPDEIQALLDQIVEEGMFNVSINGEIAIDGQGRGNVCIENIKNNLYLMRVDIIVTDSRGTQVTVYSSGILDPGYSIESAIFQIMPPFGYSDAVAVFTALDLETEQEVGRTNVAVILVREST